MKLLLIATLIAATQVATAIVFGPGSGPGSSASGPGSFVKTYSRLCAWDCAWYQSIATNGYVSTVPPLPQDPNRSNVAFFPAYPLSARLLHLLSGLDTELALLGVAGAFAILFWYSLGLLLRTLGIPPPAQALAYFAVYCHPAAFYLVAGYSESMFLSAMLLFLYLGFRDSTAAPLRAGMAGFLMSSSRIVGIPFAILPILFRRKGSDSFAIAAMTAAGGLSFLVYSLLRFGDFGLYMDTQRIGWGVVPDYAALLHWRDFQFRFPIDRITTMTSGLGFVAIGLVEAALAALRYRTGFRTRAPLYAAALLLLFITVSGLESVQFQSMIRYSLPWYCLIIVSLAHLFCRTTASLGSLPRQLFSAFTAAVVLSGCTAMLVSAQWPGLRQFLAGRWFA